MVRRVLSIHWLNHHLQISRDALGRGLGLKPKVNRTLFSAHCRSSICRALKSVWSLWECLIWAFPTFYNLAVIPAPPFFTPMHSSSSTATSFHNGASIPAVSSAWNVPPACLFHENSTHSIKPALKSCLFLEAFPDSRGWDCPCSSRCLCYAWKQYYNLSVQGILGRSW